jgi:hypothetical protein
MNDNVTSCSKQHRIETLLGKLRKVTFLELTSTCKPSERGRKLDASQTSAWLNTCQIIVSKH